jgi:hypothetical protein
MNIFIIPRIAILLLTFGLASLSHAANESQYRVALVIGNGAYKDAPLKNPVNDASDFAKKLKRYGFKVQKLINADARSMEKAIAKFGKRLRKENSVGLFYFAGHGLQVNGSNYLLPIGASIESEADIRFEAVNAARVLAQMEQAGNGLNMLVLDACRNNPYARSWRTSNRGLARMEAPSGSLILYATSPGDVAADGSGRNGLFTEKLMNAIDIKGLKIEDVFKQTAIAVSRASGKRQVPYFEGVILGDFYFSLDYKGTTEQAEIVFWNSVDQQSDPLGYEAYLKKWPEGQFAVLARQRIERLKRQKPKKKQQSLAGSIKPEFFIGKRIQGINAKGYDLNIEILSENKAQIKVDPNKLFSSPWQEEGEWFVSNDNNICFKFNRYKSGQLSCRYFKEDNGEQFLLAANPKKPVWHILSDIKSSEMDSRLSANEIKQLFADKHYTGISFFTGKQFSAYASNNGDLKITLKNNHQFTNRWWVDYEKNQHCIDHPKFGVSCGFIKDMKNGKYYRFVNDNHTATFENFH